MKVIIFGNINKNYWYVLADSAVTNTGKPFYLPEDLGRVTVSLGFSLRISRLGKHISEKFAPRYYSEAAPTLHFKLHDYEKNLINSGLPSDAARSFDKSLVVGDFQNLDFSSNIELFINNEKQLEFDLNKLPYSIESVITEVSKINTLKMGDIILPGLSSEIFVKEGDLLEVKKNGERLFHVKVK